MIARNSTFAYKGKSPDIRQVGEELGARYVIEGSIQKASNRVRVTAQLINAETGHHVWSERFDRDLHDIFELQDEITGKIAAVISPELVKAESERSTTKRADNLDAWDYCQRGKFLMNEISKSGVGTARELLEWKRGVTSSRRRRASIPKHVRRSRTGIFCGRVDGRHHHRPVFMAILSRHRSQLHLCLQRHIA